MIVPRAAADHERTLDVVEQIERRREHERVGSIHAGVVQRADMHRLRLVPRVRVDGILRESQACGETPCDAVRRDLELLDEAADATGARGARRIGYDIDGDRVRGRRGQFDKVIVFVGQPGGVYRRLEDPEVAACEFDDVGRAVRFDNPDAGVVVVGDIGNDQFANAVVAAAGGGQRQVGLVEALDNKVLIASNQDMPEVRVIGVIKRQGGDGPACEVVGVEELQLSAAVAKRYSHRPGGLTRQPDVDLIHLSIR